MSVFLIYLYSHNVTILQSSNSSLLSKANKKNVITDMQSVKHIGLIILDVRPLEGLCARKGTRSPICAEVDAVCGTSPIASYHTSICE